MFEFVENAPRFEMTPPPTLIEYTRGELVPVRHSRYCDPVITCSSVQISPGYDALNVRAGATDPDDITKLYTLMPKSFAMNMFVPVLLNVT
jgi:hypothetical protein